MESSHKGDVYPVEPMDDFPVNQVLDAHWGALNDEDVRILVAAHDCLWVWVNIAAPRIADAIALGHEQKGRVQSRGDST
ncbi:hypothetical protein CsSME_00019942 [Camellia sinensis var. sinensis]